jgi:hypothetical protein
MIPPTFPEVRKPVSESYFQDFEGNAAYPAELNISNDHHFEPPSTKVGKEMYIHSCIPDIGKEVVRIFRSIYSAIICIAFLRQGFAKIRVKEFEDLSGFFQRLK